MVTLVGTQTKFNDALKELLEFEYNNVEIYSAAINRFENSEYKMSVAEFRQDHERHIANLRNLIINSGETPANASTGKQVLMVGRIAASALIGDKMILEAMLSADEDSVIAYERMEEHAGKTLEATPVISQGLSDERRHKSWFESALANI